MKKVTISFCTMLVISTTFAQNVLNLPTGKKYIVDNKVTTTSSSDMQGQSMESNADVTTVFNIQINNVKDNNYNMTNSISAIKMNMTTMGQNVAFDSDKKEDMDGEMGNSLKDYINHPTEVVMDKSGTIINADKPDSSKKSDAASPTQMIMKQMGDPEQQGYGASMAFIAIPKKLKAGATWTDSTSKDGVVRVTNYSVKEVKGNTATISIAGTELRDAKMEMQGMEINTKTNGKFTGEEIVDITTGVISQNNTTMEASGKISVMGQEIPTTIKATSVTTVKPM